MHASIPASEPVTLDPVYILRDEIAQIYNPANAYERMLVTAVAQASVRVRRAQELERRLLELADRPELSSSKALKAIARMLADCERTRSLALHQLQQAIRNRTNPTGMSPNARRRPGISLSVPTQNRQNEPRRRKSRNEPEAGRNYNEGFRR
jgi:hypothetical protein